MDNVLPAHIFWRIVKEDQVLSCESLQFYTTYLHHWYLILLMSYFCLNSCQIVALAISSSLMKKHTSKLIQICRTIFKKKTKLIQYIMNMKIVIGYLNFHQKGYYNCFTIWKIVKGF